MVLARRGKGREQVEEWESVLGLVVVLIEVLEEEEVAGEKDSLWRCNDRFNRLFNRQRT